MKQYEYFLLAHDHVEDLLPAVQGLGKEGWYIVATIQEHAFTKIILERENDVNF